MPVCKRVEDEIAIYEIPDDICDRELETIDSMVDDFLRHEYRAMVIDSSRKVKKRLKQYIPFAKDERYEKIRKIEEKHEKDYNLRMKLSFGAYSLINYALGYYISGNILNLDNPWVGSALFGTSSLAAMGACFAIEKYSTSKKRDMIEREKETIKMMECVLSTEGY